jgi:hypothetical protein
VGFRVRQSKRCCDPAYASSDVWTPGIDQDKPKTGKVADITGCETKAIGGGDAGDLQVGEFVGDLVEP